jgi:DNA polymerase-4
MDPAILQSNLGQKAGDYIWKSANGIGSSVVRPQHEKAKSYSNEETTPEDISSENYRTKGLEIVQRLGRKVASRMEKDHVMAKTIQVIVKTDDFRRHSRQATIGSATADPAVICREAEALMDQMLFSADGIFKSGRTLRLIGVGCSGLTDGAYQQMDLLSWMKEAPVRDEKQRKKKKLEEMMRQASSRFGADAIRRGTGGSFESGADSQKR